MTYKRIIVLFVFCGLLNQALGQSNCVPNNVESIEVAANATLFWHVNPDEPCEISSYRVDIEGDRGDEYHFTVQPSITTLNVSYLEICEKWHFTVTPVSGYVFGYPRSVTTHIPLPPDADLALSEFNFTISGRNIFLNWDLRNQTHGDCSLKYRVTLEDLDLGVIQDFYVENKTVQLNDISPCIYYAINLRAVNQAHPTIEGPDRRLNMYLNPRVQTAPVMKTVEIGATTINMTWALEGETNRCPLRTFYANGGIYFNQTVSLQGIEDPTRVQVQISSLQPNSMYYIEGYVANSGGISPPGPVAVQTLELSPS